jgi:uncharacterized protein YjbJ (UPF0337 family)
MNTDILKGKWQQLKGEAKIQWGKLTDDDIDQVEGNAQKLIGKVQERYGYDRARAEREVDDWLNRGDVDRPAGGGYGGESRF